MTAAVWRYDARDHAINTELVPVFEAPPERPAPDDGED